MKSSKVGPLRRMLFPLSTAAQGQMEQVREAHPGRSLGLHLCKGEGSSHLSVSLTHVQIAFPQNLLKFAGDNHSHLLTGNAINGAVLKCSRTLFPKWCHMLPDVTKLKTFSFNDCQNILESFKKCKMLCGSDVGIAKQWYRSCFQGKASPCTDKGPGGVGCALESTPSLSGILVRHQRTLLHLENGDSTTHLQTALKLSIKKLSTHCTFK